jgi:pimeloyl-ACP methyl ester carboxylesterase
MVSDFRMKMQRRAVITAPLFLGAASALARAQSKTEGAAARELSTEEFQIPARDPEVKLYLRNKRPRNTAAARPDRTILFVHGLTYAASAVFDLPLQGSSWMDFIAARGFDVWSVDIRGFGRSSRPLEFSLPASRNPPYLDAETATSDLSTAAAFIRQRRGLPRLTILAWSWGTVLAARHATQNPDLVERLVLYAPVWLWQGPDPSPSAPPGAYRSVTTRAARDGWLNGAPESMRSTLLPPGWFEAWASSVWATDPEGARMDPPVLRVPNGPLVEVAENWKAGRAFFNPADVLAPTQLVVGEWDRTTPPSQALALFAQLTKSRGKRLVVLPEGTHSIFLERNRGSLLSTVQAFLEEDIAA